MLVGDDQDMLHIPMHEILRKHLAATGLNQSQFADRTGIRRRRVSKLLSGKAAMKGAELARLCKLFPRWARDLRTSFVPRRRKKTGGRTALPANRELHRLVKPPRRFLSRQRIATRRLWHGLRKHDAPVMDGLRAAIRAREDLTECLQHLHRTRCDSKFELSVYAHALADGAGICEASVLRLGFTRLPAVDEDTREPVGHRPMVAYLLRSETLRVLLLPQVSLEVENGTVYTLDALALVIHGRRRIWIDFEVDGSGHRSTWDRQRAEALGLPEARFNEEDVVASDFLDRFWKKVEGLL